MDYKKKLKIRLYAAIGYIVLGILAIVGNVVFKAESDFASGFGLAIIVMGVVRVRNYFIITKSEERTEIQRIAETDERNIDIMQKAKSVTFNIYVLLMALLTVVFYAIKKESIGQICALTLCLFVVIYWVSYLIIRKKS